MKKAVAKSQSDTTKVMSLTRLSDALTGLKRFEEANQTGKDALTLAERTDFDIGKVNAYYAISNCYVQKYEFTTALPYAEKGIKLAENLADRHLLAQLYQVLWSIHHHDGKFAPAIRYINKSLRIYQSLNNEALVAGCYSNLGVSHQVQGLHTQALEYHQKSLKIYEKINMKANIAICLNNIGDIYENIKKYDDALVYYDKAFKMNEMLKNTGGMSVCLVGMASCYRLKYNYDKSLDCAQRALALAEKINHKVLINYGLTLLSNLYIIKEDYSEAYNCAQKSLAVNKESGFREGTMDGLILLGVIYFETGKYTEARKHLLQANRLGNELKLLKQQSACALLLARSDSALGNFKSAYEYFRQYKLHNDSLNNSDKSQEIGRLEASFQYDGQIKDQERRREIEAERNAKNYSIFGIIILFFLMLTGFIFYRYRSNVKTSKLLHMKNYRIELQKEELESANEALQFQKQEIEQKNLKIEDSIRYAYQIQTAILPDQSYLDAILPQHFIYYQPKDIVSGDFYWASSKYDLLYVCVADCTGHGVPGAFMSVVGANALHNTINQLGLGDPHMILYELDRSLRTTLRQGQNSESKDGMDIALCIFSPDKCYFSGAGRPIYHFQNGQIHEIKGDKFPIGGGQYENKKFTVHQFNLLQGDRVYLFSDGITDQFGGEDKRKLTPKRLKEFIINHADCSIEEQGKLFQAYMKNWMNGNVQLDDLTLLGIEISGNAIKTTNE